MGEPVDGPLTGKFCGSRAHRCDPTNQAVRTCSKTLNSATDHLGFDAGWDRRRFGEARDAHSRRFIGFVSNSLARPSVCTERRRRRSSRGREGSDHHDAPTRSRPTPDSRRQRGRETGAARRSIARATGRMRRTLRSRHYGRIGIRTPFVRPKLKGGGKAESRLQY